MAAGVFGIGAHDRGVRQMLFEKANGASRHDRDHDGLGVDQRREERQRVGRGLRLHRDHQRGDIADVALGIDAHAALGQRLDRLRRLRLQHDDLLRRQLAGEPAVEHGAAHLAGADQHERAGNGGEGFCCFG
jgi:hypothetical protein